MVTTIVTVISLVLCMVFAFLVGLAFGLTGKYQYGTSEYRKGLEDGYNKRKVEEKLDIATVELDTDFYVDHEGDNGG